MTKLLHIVFLAVAALMLLPGCAQKEAPQPEEHPNTQEELVKKHLDDTFSKFIVALDPESVEWTAEYLAEHSRVTIFPSGTIAYYFRKDGKTLLSADFRAEDGDWYTKVSFFGGMRMEGTVKPTLSIDWEEWENNWDIDVYDGEDAVAKLGIVSYVYSGQLIPMPVFRFPDGTSYSVTTVLIIEPLIDYLLENVLSTQ